MRSAASLAQTWASKGTLGYLPLSTDQAGELRTDHAEARTGLRCGTESASVSGVKRPAALRFSSFALFAVMTSLVAAAPAPAEAPYRGPLESGRLAAPPKNEASGIAASRRTPDLLWLHDDSGGAAALYAVGPDGRGRGMLQIGGGVKNIDWEDLAAVELDGRAWLVIGDIGDNDADRRMVALHLVPEPTAAEMAVAGKLAERPAATLRLAYEDGPHDAEALAVDPAERAVYLLTKRDTVPRLYRAALPPPPLKDAALTARYVGLVPELPKPTSAQAALKGHVGKQRARPCAMDFAPDGSAAVVLTYGDVLLFPRRASEPWADALARKPIPLGAHNLPQAEAVCFSPDGARIYVASESSRELLRYERN